jgi:hypothetical protein
MEYQTTLRFGIAFYDISKTELIQKIDNLQSFIKEKNSVFEFQFLENGEIIVGADVDSLFEKFKYFLNSNVEISEEEIKITESEEYLSVQATDLEMGEYEFSKSFIIDYENYNISIFVNTNALFSSEIGKFDSRDFGIYVEMNDYLGDYREFDI